MYLHQAPSINYCTDTVIDWGWKWR